MNSRLIAAMILGLMAVGCSAKVASNIDELDRKQDLQSGNLPLSESISLERAVKDEASGSLGGEAKGTSERRKSKARREIDWGPRYVQLLEHCASRFSEPEIGSKMTLTLESGKEITGVLEKVTDSWVHLKVKSGGLVKLATEDLSTDSRCQLYKQEYVEYFATKRLEEEKSIFQKTGKLPK